MDEAELLAGEAGVGRPAASEHVARLEAAGLVTTTVEGRHKHVRLAGPGIAEVLESLCGLAGRLGVAVLDGLLDGGVLRRRRGLVVTRAGRAWFGDLGIFVDELEQQRRVLLRDCVDLTERRPHLAGSLGASLCATFHSRGWARRAGSDRALQVTPAGEQAVERLLGIAPAALVVG